VCPTEGSRSEVQAQGKGYGTTPSAGMRKQSRRGRREAASCNAHGR
jgi:hypothetical protein